MLQFLYLTFFGNTVLDYFWFIFALIVSFLVLKLAERFCVKHLSVLSNKRKKPIDLTVFNSIRKNMMPILYLIAFYLCTKILYLNPTLTKWVSNVILAVTIAIGATLVSSLAVFVSGRYIRTVTDAASTKLILKWTSSIIKIIIWTVALILFLDNIGVKITSLVTGLGIGGVAFAFAAQAILVDIFCCFTIFFDKPFEVGDFIITGEQMGTVEHIGMKTTRLRSLNGEQIVLANSDLTKSRISNYKTLAERRVLFRIGVTYETSYEKLKEIPGLIKSIVESVSDTRFSRTHFCSYGTYSLDFETVYFVLSNNYDKYMDVNQEVYFRIKEAFEQHGIEFAYPTQTLQVQKLPGA